MRLLMTLLVALIASTSVVQAQMTLRQEQQNEVVEFRGQLWLLGFCGSYFDITGKPGEALELGGAVSREEARRFLKELPTGLRQVSAGISTKYVVAKRLGQALLPLSEDEANAIYDKAVEEGKRQSPKEAFAHYQACVVFAPSQEMIKQKRNEEIAKELKAQHEKHAKEEAERIAKLPPVVPPTAEEKQKADALIDEILRQPAQPPQKQQPAPAVQQAPNPTGLAALTASELEVFSRKLRACISQQDRHPTAIIPFAVDINRDGTPIKASLVDNGRYHSDPTYRAAADAAHRAIMNPRCGQWALPPAKYESWRTMRIDVNPRDY